MSDYSMMGSFSTGGASALNGELIQKLKDAETKSKVVPIDKKLDDWQVESDKMTEINEKVDALYAAIKPFDLFNSGANAFEQISANTAGDSVIFDAIDVGSLNEGTINVDITQLAQKDVYQTNTFSDPTALVDGGQDDDDEVSIKVGDTTYDFTTVDKTYNELAADINLNENLSASVEQVGDDTYRLVIKSADEGQAITIKDKDNGVDLGIQDSDGDGTDDDGNHILTAQNLKATVDGVDYDVSASNITVDGNLKITATKLGTSSISVSKDYNSIVPMAETLSTTYNDLTKTINDEILSADNHMKDTSSLKNMLSDIKAMFYDTTGDDNTSLFSYGFGFDKHGSMTLDSAKFGESLTTNFDTVKSLFLGAAEDKGIGTKLKEYLDDSKAYNGTLKLYTNSMNDRKTKLEDNKVKTVKMLDQKYDDMAAQFAAYGAMISQMEASFGGLKMTIEQSTTSK